MERKKRLIGTNGSSIAAEGRQTDASNLCTSYRHTGSENGMCLKIGKERL